MFFHSGNHAYGISKVFTVNDIKKKHIMYLYRFLSVFQSGKLFPFAVYSLHIVSRMKTELGRQKTRDGHQGGRLGLPGGPGLTSLHPA